MDEKTAEARAALARAEARAADERAELAKGLKDDHERALAACKAERDAAVHQAAQEAALERDASLRKAEARLKGDKEAALQALAEAHAQELREARRAHEAASALDAEARRRFCRDNFVDERALQELGGLRRQFRSHLVDAGLLDTDAPRRPLADALALVRGLLVAGLNPHVARKDREAPDASLRCKGNQRWWVHPQSVNFELLGGRGDARKPRYVVYNARLKTSKPYLLDTSLASPAALCLFGSGELFFLLRLVAQGVLESRRVG